MDEYKILYLILQFALIFKKGTKKMIPGYETTYIIQEDLTGNVKVLYCLSDCLETMTDYAEREIPFTLGFMSTKSN